MDEKEVLKTMKDGIPYDLYEQGEQGKIKYAIRLALDKIKISRK